MNGLDVELAWPYVSFNTDLGGSSGFAKPSIGLKYAVPDVGAGGFVDFTLPMGSEDFVGPDPAMAIMLGALYGGAVGPLNLLANVNYTLNMEADDYKDGNVFGILVKPEFPVSEMLGVYTMLDWDFSSEDEAYGDGMDDAGNLLTLTPGANIAINDMISLETNVPLTVMGKNDGALWGINVLTYFTFGP